MTNVLEIRKLVVSLGDVKILDGIDLSLSDGEILGLVGGSGTGKTVLLRSILGLHPYRRGKVIFPLSRNTGVLFQHGALFSSLTVKENIQLPMRRHTSLPLSLLDDLALMRMDMVGLPRSACDKYPSQLSGGMIKRAGLARALSLDAQLLFLDEPTSGLDPISARAIERLILSLRESLGLSVLLVSHDLDSLRILCDRVAVLRDRRILTTGSLSEVSRYPDPWIDAYFNDKERVG